MLVDPEIVFQGTLVFVAPHMDDEVLACGGTIAQLPGKDRIHIVYATDGSKSPVPSFPWMGSTSKDLPRIRKAESMSALDVLGIPARNLHFLTFPDGELRKNILELRRVLGDLYDRLQPDQIFIPFRYDRHPDHLALHEAALKAHQSLDRCIQVIEYFVYYRWRMLPGGDVRKLIRPEYLVTVDVLRQSDRKRNALQCYKSQTTCYFPWQARPILPPERVAEVSYSPEMFLRYNAHISGPAIFSRLQRWITLAHRIEPALKKRKDQIQILMRSGIFRHVLGA